MFGDGQVYLGTEDDFEIKVVRKVVSFFSFYFLSYSSYSLLLISSCSFSLFNYSLSSFF